VAAFREYVRRGGRLYASRYTSLTETGGTRHADFQLADVFGCHFAADDLGAMAYLKPRTPELADWIAPQKYLSLSTELVMFGPRKDQSSVKGLRLGQQVEGDALATLTLPYCNATSGTVFDHNWSSIHSSPPWEDTEHPVLVSHAFGKGQAIYSAADIECLDCEAANELFTRLIYRLLDKPLAYTTDAHPAVWMSVFHQPQNKRFVIGFLNYQTQWPVLPIPNLSFSLQSPLGERFTRLQRLPDESDLSFTEDAGGRLHAEVTNLGVFQMLMASTASTGPRPPSVQPSPPGA
jgi:hypothetical protein